MATEAVAVEQRNSDPAGAGPTQDLSPKVCGLNFKIDHYPKTKREASLC